MAKKLKARNKYQLFNFLSALHILIVVNLLNFIYKQKYQQENGRFIQANRTPKFLTTSWCSWDIMVAPRLICQESPLREHVAFVLSTFSSILVHRADGSLARVK